MKRRKNLRLLSLVCLLPLLAACGSREGSSAELTVLEQGAYYELSAQTLPPDALRSNCVCYDAKGATLYYLALTEEGSRIYACDSSLAYQELPDFSPPALGPEEADGESAIPSYLGLAADGRGGLWLAMSFTLGGDNRYLLYQLDRQGALVQTISLDEAVKQAGGAPLPIHGLAGAGFGGVYLALDNGVVLALDEDGQLTFSVKAPAPSRLRQVLPLADGNAGAWLSGPEGDSLRPIDEAAREWGGAIILPGQIDYLAASSHHDFLYSSGGSLFACDAEALTSAKLLTWLDQSIQAGEIIFCQEATDGAVLCLRQNSTSAGNDNFLLRLTHSDAPPERITLTLATLLSVGDINAAIAEFNSSQSRYHIEQVEYLWQAEGQVTAALHKLSTEIITGQGPDLFVTFGLPLRQYISAGLLEDIYPWLDGDGELSRDSLLSQLLQAWDSGGHLYSVAPNFSIYTGLGRADVVGEKMNWTQEDLLAAWERQPQLTQPIAMLEGCAAPDIFSALCGFALESFVDWQEGTCDFDSPEFIALLEYAARFPRQVPRWGEPGYVEPEQMLAEGKSLLQWTFISDYGDLQSLAQACGGPITYTGLPTADGNGYAFDSGQNMVAMSSQSQHKEGCWEFLRLLLSEEFQIGLMDSTFVSNQAAFERKQALAMEMGEDEHGRPQAKDRYTTGYGDAIYYVKTATEAEVAQTMALIAATNRTLDSDPFLTDIVQQEAAAFFAGQNSAAEAARIIQSRVGIYVNEQR